MLFRSMTRSAFSWKVRRQEYSSLLAQTKADFGQVTAESYFLFLRVEPKQSIEVSSHSKNSIYPNKEHLPDD